MVWLEDENLQQQEVYLPSLPKQHDPHRLAKIMHNQQVSYYTVSATFPQTLIFFIKIYGPLCGFVSGALDGVCRYGTCSA